MEVDLREILSGSLLVPGAVLCLIGGFGLLRLPEGPGCGVAPRPESTLARAAG